MKVVLFCGGFGMRLREYSESIPKPMVTIGYRPILWHVMKYYAHYGHKDFILCLGWKANVIKDYFLNYDECVSNDFVLSGGGKNISLLNSDIHDWNITFVDTGVSACIGERLKAVQPHLEGEKTFLANYTDGLASVDLPRLINFHDQSDSVATFVSVRPSQTFHKVSIDEAGGVQCIQEISKTDTWMNGGFFVFSNQFFDYLDEGEELVDQPFQRLIAEGKLRSMRHEGFWGCMDTYKEKQMLEDMYDRGDIPWAVWDKSTQRVQDADHPVTSNAQFAAKPLPR
ncbi:Glucose-1-phosphate cytidylyltransferase [Stieleria neptunia]|uniref:Glucose-1-phosphate cytidylyltransferase n=1 Tax=Stieleria neptunia TaxID=2527979 RepID=A0A518HT84_9BACT|nr:glucose-1-phosphate cytidylyltransferase [Stieleria neptunia]QDV44007.1 Glucose-1-phosphate cytidylyltransferase [Stieleria neptunia]